MIDFKRAAAGIGKVFKGEILELISAVVIIIGTIAGYVAIADLKTTGTENASDVALGSSITMLVMIIAGGIIALIALIFKLTGLGASGSQNSNFKVALYIAIAAFAVLIISNIVSSLTSSEIVSALITAIRTALNAIVTIMVLKGCGELLAEKGNTELAEHADLVSTRVIIAFVLAAVLNVVPGFTNSTVDIICAIAAVVCSVIAYIQYLIMIAKTRKVLNEDD